MDKRTRVKLILLAVVVVMGCGLAYLTARIMDSSKEEKFPECTLEAEQGETVYLESEILSLVLNCPNLKYNISIPDNIVSSSGETVVSSYGGYKIAMMESPDGFESALAGGLNTAGVSAVSAMSATWETVISGSGYGNGYPAEYAAGRAVITHDGMQTKAYGVAYRLLLSDEASVYLYVSCSSIDSIDGAKSLLDSILYTVREGYSDGSEADGEEDSAEESEAASTPDAVPDAEADSDVEDIEFMESTDAGEEEEDYEDGEIHTATKEIYVDSDYEDMIIRFRWTNSGTVMPESIIVTGPDGKEYEHDKKLGWEGDYIFRIGKVTEKGTYTITIKTMDVLKGCMYYADEYEEWYHEMYPDDEDIILYHTPPHNDEEEEEDYEPTADELFDGEESMDALEEEEDYVDGEIHTSTKEIYVDSVYEDMIIRFMWTSSGQALPESIIVTGPDGKEYEHDKKLSDEGDYIFRIGEVTEKGTYTITTKSMDVLKGCIYYADEYMEWYYETWQ